MIHHARTLLLLTGLVLAGSVALAQTDTGADTGTDAAAPSEAVAYFAGGCFWCTEADFEKIEGVSEAISGYMGGELENPTYEQVSTNETGHRETVEVRYDPDVVSYQELLDAFWRMHDPTDAGGSFVDRGESYTSAIYTVGEEQQRLAEGSRAALEASGKFDDPIATVIEPAEEFWAAEDYHQDYYEKSALRYRFYRFNSGRDQFIDRVWKGDDTVYRLDSETGGRSFHEELRARVG